MPDVCATTLIFLSENQGWQTLKPNHSIEMDPKPKKLTKEMKKQVMEQIEKKIPNASKAEKLKVLKNIEETHLDHPDGSISYIGAPKLSPKKSKKKVLA